MDTALLVLNSFVGVSFVSVCNIEWESFLQALNDQILLLLIYSFTLLQCLLLSSSSDLFNVIVDLLLNKHSFHKGLFIEKMLSCKGDSLLL